MNLSKDDFFDCPYCGSSNSLFPEFSGPSRQRFVTDCETCCKPIAIEMQINGGEISNLRVARENE